MGLFSSSNTTTQNRTNVATTSNVEVNPLTNVTVVSANNTGAIEAGFQGLSDFLGGAVNALTGAGSSLGGGVNGAGINIGYGLLVGAGVYALARSKK